MSEYTDDLRKKWLETLLSQYSRIAKKSDVHPNETEETTDNLLDELKEIYKKKGK